MCDSVVAVTSTVWMTKSRARDARRHLPDEPQLVSSPDEFLAARRDANTVAFLDAEALSTLDEYARQHASAPERRKLLSALTTGPTVGVCDEPLATAIGWLPMRPWLSHVMSGSMFEGKLAGTRVAEAMKLSERRDLRDWLKPHEGRRVRLTHASRREQRLDRMIEFFKAQGVDTRSSVGLRELANELLVNAFYEGPLAAGVVKQRIERGRDVALPDDLACDVAYGLRDDLAIVRVRDPFGALSRERLVEVLTHRTRTGLWRVFSDAMIVTVSVNAYHYTQVLVAVPIKAVSHPPYAFHLFFKKGAREGTWKLISEDTGSPLANTSVTLTRHEAG